MKYKFSGTIQSNIDFRGESLSIDISNSCIIRYPTSSLSSINPKFSFRHEFQGTLEACNQTDATQLAENYAGLLAELLSIRVKLGVGEAKVITVFRDEPSNELIARLRGSSEVYANLTAIESLPENFELTVSSDFQKLVSDKNKLESARTVMKLYKDASTKSDNVGKFWSYYLIFTILKGDRIRSIDNYLKTTDFGKNLYHNDKKKQDTTSITAIRDSFSHSDATFSGVSLDLNYEVNEIIDDFQEVTRQLIIKTF